MKNKEEKPEMPPVSLTDNLLDNLVELRALFGGSADLTIRRMTVCSREIALVTVEGMVDRHLMADAVILPMARMTGESASAETLISRIRDEVLGFVDMQQVTTFGELANLITSGFAAVLVEGVPYAVLGGLQGFMIRGISEPSTEVTVRGSREGFTEAIRVNISMVRRRLKSPALAFEMLTAGKTTQTAVCPVLYAGPGIPAPARRYPRAHPRLSARGCSRIGIYPAFPGKQAALPFHQR